MAYQADLNCDLGESFGAYTMGMDAEIIPQISSANLACGFHAGDPQVMRSSVAAAAAAGVKIGAHPGFADLAGFGRRNMALSPDELYTSTLYQIGALAAFCTAQGQRLQHVKAHGAMYNMAGSDPQLAQALARAVYDFDRSLIVLALAGSEMVKAARTQGLRVAQEVFADRAYEPDGSLVSRRSAAAVIHDEEIAIARVLRMVKEGKIEAINGADIDIQADSICVHGDGEKALLFVAKIRAAFADEGILIRPLCELV